MGPTLFYYMHGPASELPYSAQKRHLVWSTRHTLEMQHCARRMKTQRTTILSLKSTVWLAKDWQCDLLLLLTAMQELVELAA